MPRLKTRTFHAVPNPQVNTPDSSRQGQDGNGLQNFDGRANLGAGTQHSAVPETLNGPQVYVKTNSVNA